MSPTEAPSVIVAEKSAVWPMQAEPYKLWSLLDMLRLYNATLITVIVELDREKGFLLWPHSDYNPFASQYAEQLASTRKALDQFIDECERHDPRFFIPNVVAQAKRLRKRLEEEHVLLNRDLVVALINEFEANLQEQLTDWLYFAVPPQRKWMYLEPEKWFGTSVVEAFPDTRRDARDACQCFALAQWTASVFHSMRIAEHGLHWLADALGVTWHFENWKNVIDQIEKEIRKRENQPKGPEKSAELEFYSRVASHFWYFKEAWRNHVSHSRASYDEQDAVQVLNNVRDVMRDLAARMRA